MSFEYSSFPTSYYFSWLSFISKGTPSLSSRKFFSNFWKIMIPVFYELSDLFMGEKYCYLFHNHVHVASFFRFMF